MFDWLSIGDAESQDCGATSFDFTFCTFDHGVQRMYPSWYGKPPTSCSTGKVALNQIVKMK